MPPLDPDHPGWRLPLPLNRCVACLEESPKWKLCDSCYQLVLRWKQRDAALTQGISGVEAGRGSVTQTVHRQDDPPPPSRRV